MVLLVDPDCLKLERYIEGMATSFVLYRKIDFGNGDRATLRFCSLEQNQTDCREESVLVLLP